MRVVIGLTLLLGGIWLAWLVLIGLPFPWESPNNPAFKPNQTNQIQKNNQAAFTPLGGQGTPSGGINPL